MLIRINVLFARQRALAKSWGVHYLSKRTLMSDVVITEWGSLTCDRIGSEASRIKYSRPPVNYTRTSRIWRKHESEAMHPNPTFADRKLSHLIQSAIKTVDTVRNWSWNMKHDGLLATCGIWSHVNNWFQLHLVALTFMELCECSEGKTVLISHAPFHRNRPLTRIQPGSYYV